MLSKRQWLKEHFVTLTLSSMHADFSILDVSVCVILLMFGWVSAFSKQKVKEKEKDKEKDKDSSEKPKEKVKAEKSEKAKEQKSKEKEKERSKSKEKEGKEKTKERLKDKDKERSGNKSKYSSPAGVPESPKDGEYEKGQFPSPPLLSLIALNGKFQQSRSLIQGRQTEGKDLHFKHALTLSRLYCKVSIKRSEKETR